LYRACRGLPSLTFTPNSGYQEQWLKLLEKAEEIRQFIAENKSKLKVKE